LESFSGSNYRFFSWLVVLGCSQETKPDLRISIAPEIVRAGTKSIASFQSSGGTLRIENLLVGKTTTLPVKIVNAGHQMAWIEDMITGCD